MTIKPAITLIIAIGFWVIFELLVNYSTKRWRLVIEKELWAALYWVVIIGSLVSCRIIPLGGRGLWIWGPFFGMALLHAFLCMNYYFCVCLPPAPKPVPPPDPASGSTTNGSGRRTTPSKLKGVAKP